MRAADRTLVSLVGIAHALVHTYELSFPILLGAWLLEFDTTRAVLGLVLTVGYGLFGLGALPTGVVVDSIGPRRVLVVCLSGMGAAFVLLGVATGPISVAAVLIVWGVAASMYHPAGLTLISTAARDRGAVFAYHGMAGNLGIALGPLCTALLLVVLDWRLVVAILGLPALLAGGYTLRATIPPAHTDESNEGVGPDTREGFIADSKTLLSGAFLGILGVVILSGLYYRGVLTFLPDILRDFEGFDPVTVGAHTLEPGDYFFVAILVVGVLGQYLGGRLSDRPDSDRILGGIFLVLALLAAGFVPLATGAIPVFIAGGLLLGLALFMVQPLYQAAVADHTPRSARGLSYGFTYLGVFGVGAAGSALAGVALTYASVETLFASLAAIGLLAALSAAAVWWFGSND